MLYFQYKDNFFFLSYQSCVFVQVDDISDQVRNKEEENRQLQEEMEDARKKQGKNQPG